MEGTSENTALDREAEIIWLCRESYYNEMAKRAKEACNAHPSSEVLRLLFAVGQALINKVNDSINLTAEFTNEMSPSDTSLLAGLFVESLANRLAGSADRASLSRIDARIRDERRRASGVSLARAATVLFLFRRYERAREYIERALKQEPNDRTVCVIGAWVFLYEAAQPKTGKSVAKTLLERARDLLRSYAETTGDLNVTLAMAKLEEMSGRHTEAISRLSALVVRHPRSSLPLVERMNNQLACGDWDEAMSSAERALTLESNCIDALKARAIVAICRDGNLASGLRNAQTFFRNLTIAEPNNYDLILDCVQLFSRVSSRHAGLLNELTRITEKLIEQSDKKLARPMIELGNLCVLAGRTTEAENAYREAVRIDESSFTALTGLANCRVIEKPSTPSSVTLARQQIDFLTEMTNEVNLIDKAIVHFMSAKLYANEPNKALDHIARSVTSILDTLPSSSNIPSETFVLHRGYYHYLNDLNPVFCLDIVEEYLLHCPCRFFVDTEADGERSETTNDGNERDLVCSLLEKLVGACPGMGVALLMLAKVRIQTGYFEEALAALRKLLDSVDPPNSAGHLLTAQIYAHQAQYDLAEQSLELGLSFDFRVRDDPMYHLVSSIIDREKGRTEARADSLRQAIKLIEDGTTSSLTAPISTSDKATLYIELVGACASLGKFDEAITLMEQARDLFGRSLEESRLVIANADLHLRTGNIDEAIDCLAQITPRKPYYLEAHTKLAGIYLERRKDRQAFAKCFRELVQHCPGPRTYSMLGDAYMAIQEPDRAIEAYEESLAQNPLNRRLAERMGKALIKTHQYGKAIGYYREITKNKACSDLKLDLAELYMRVKQFDKAENVLVQELQVESRSDARGANDLSSLERRGCHLMLLAKIRERAGNLQSALATLKEAKENQIRCLQRAPVGATSITTQKQVLAAICLDMADHASSLRDYNQAIERYKEALSHKPADIKALLSLAKLYMQVNDLDRCGQSCLALLNADPDNEAASVMMADLAFRKVDFETAAFHFRQLLLRRPTYWTALARLIEVSRRTGNTDDLDEWLKRGAAASEGSNREAGYYYCSGLLDWRTGKLNSALRNFNCARRDPEWGQQAIYNMIEICLDPDDDSSLSSEAFNDDEDSEYHDSRTMALKTAQRLLLELSPKGNAHEMLTHRLLGDFFLLATKQKPNIEKALQDCTNLASQESLRDHVGPALGLAMAHILMKQTPRARNHLKRVSKNVWTFEDAEYLERCWLLLADIYVQSSKYDLANELLKRVLQHNATCVRAHELSGHIAEREQNYREAATRYSQAWKYGGKTKLSVGYKLAYCFSKCKAYADAIKVCNEVLRQNPDFPRIKKDILEKSMNNIRS